MPILFIASVRAKWRLEPGASGITSEGLSLDGCLLRGWQEGRTPGPGPQAGALATSPSFPVWEHRPLRWEGFWGPWVGVGHIALCS